jgi:hypothetical protein
VEVPGTSRRKQFEVFRPTATIGSLGLTVEDPIVAASNSEVNDVNPRDIPFDDETHHLALQVRVSGFHRRPCEQNLPNPGERVCIIRVRKMTAKL